MQRLINFFTKICDQFLPDAFVFSLLLTLLVFIASWVFTPHSPFALVEFWGKDFWSLNAFAMQMVFILISGHMLATAPLMQKILSYLVSKVHSESMALIVIAIFSALACYVNWGFGLIISGILATELAKKLGKVNFGLMVATAYAGFLVWHGGLSGSIPLKIAGNDEVLQRVFPGLSIGLDKTIFATWNLLILFSLILLLPILALWMRTDDKQEILMQETKKNSSTGSINFRDRIENFSGLNFIFFIFFLVFFFQSIRKGDSLDINKVNWIFLFMALVMHQTPKNFLQALQSSFGFASGIVIQFPFYAGLMGLMQHSGLADQIAAQFVQISTPKTLPLWTFLSGGLVNFFIPSGGGQWVVQGPIMLKTAAALGVDPGKISMALAWGDAWTNLVQPFWALPILGLAKLHLKDIMGYCLVYTFFSGLIISLIFYFS